MATKSEHTRLLALGLLLALAGCTPSPEELMTRARDSLEKGDFRSATIDLKSLLQKEPQNAKARALLGEAFAASGDIGAAEIELQKARDLGAPAELVMMPSCRVLAAQTKFADVLDQCKPESVPAGHQRVALQVINGGALLGLERTADAKAMYQGALAADPNNLDALLGLAATAEVDGGLPAARTVMDGASEELKGQSRYWLSHAGINVALRDLEAAEKDYQTAIDRATGGNDSVERLMALGGLAETQMRRGHVEAADATTAKLMKLAPNHPLVKQLRAQVAAAGGKTDEARTLLEELIASHPDNLDARTMLGIVNMQQGNLDQAQMHLQDVVAKQPGNVRAQRLLAEIRARLGTPAESLAGVKSALQETQNDPGLLAMAGRLSLASGDRQQALTYLEAASQGGGDSGAQAQLDVANAYLMAGEVDRALELLESMPTEGTASRQRDAMLLLTLLRKGDQDKLLAEARSVLQRNPKDAAIRGLVGGIYAAAGKADLAREQFLESSKLAPNDAGPYINLARLDLVQNKADSAEANFKRALEKDPRNLMATLGLAATANLRKDDAAVQSYLSQAAKEHPEAIEAHRTLAQYYLQKGDAAKARAVIDAAAQANPQSAGMANARGLILAGAQDLPGAIASFEEAVRLDPRSVAFTANLVRAKLANRDATGALATLDGALQVNPKSAALLTLSAATALQSGKVEKASGYAERLRKVAPDVPTTLAVEGDLAMAQKRYKDAVASYRKARTHGSNTQLVLGEYRAATLAGEQRPERVLEAWVATNPGDVAVVTQLAEYVRGQGNVEKAISLYEAALAKVPDNVVLLNNLANLYDGRDDAKALDYAQRAYKTAPKAGAIADTYGWILFRQGKTDQALPLIQEAAKSIPDNAEVQYHLAAVLAKQGDKAQAAKHLDKALRGQLPAGVKAEVQKLQRELAK